MSADHSTPLPVSPEPEETPLPPLDATDPATLRDQWALMVEALTHKFRPVYE